MRKILLLTIGIFIFGVTYSQTIPKDAITFYTDSVGNFKVTYSVDRYPNICIEDNMATLMYYKCRIVRNSGMPNDTIDCVRNNLVTRIDNPTFMSFMDQVWTNQTKLMLRNILINIVSRQPVEAGGILPPGE